MRDYLTSYVSTQAPGVRNASGIAYVIIKTKNGKPRVDYIKDCMLKGCVTVAFENGGFLENVPVAKHVWGYIKFPEKEDKFGSCVVWSNIDKRNSIVILAVIPKTDEINNIAENQFSLSRSLDDKHLEISGDAKAGIINISVDGGKDKGELMINVFNKNKSSKLSVNVKGNISLDVDGKVDLFTSQGISIRNKNETFIILLSDLIKELKNSIVNTPSGPGNISPSTITLIEKVETRIKTLFIENGTEQTST
jgi:hypothetical protein